MKEKYANAEMFRTPELQDYFSLLDTPLVDPKRNREVRIRTWWEGNHIRRGKESPGLSDKERENLTALLASIDGDSVRERLLRAEMFRELGQFVDAQRCLLEPIVPEFEYWGKMIEDLARGRVSRVAQLPVPQEPTIFINSAWLSS